MKYRENFMQSLQLVFVLIKYLLKLVTFFVKIAQNWWKWPKRLCQYFLGDHRYDCNCFRGFLCTSLATSHSHIMAVNRILQKSPCVLVNSCLFWHFWGDFWQVAKSSKKMNSIFNMVEKSMKFSFLQGRKRSKSMNLIFCKLKKSSKSMNQIFWDFSTFESEF